MARMPRRLQRETNTERRQGRRVELFGASVVVGRSWWSSSLFFAAQGKMNASVLHVSCAAWCLVRRLCQKTQKVAEDNGESQNIVLQRLNVLIYCRNH